MSVLMTLFLLSMAGMILSIVFSSKLFPDDPEENALPLIFFFLTIVFAYSAAG